MVRAVALPTITDDSALGGAVIERSLRFNDDDNAYLNKTFSGAGNTKTFTISFWFKMGLIPSSASMNAIGTGVNNQNDFMIGFSYDGSRSTYIHVLSRDSGSTVVHVSTNRKLRDPSAWYHAVISVDTTQSTSSDRVKIYINGSQETSLSNSTYPSQNTDLRFNSANAHYVGTTRDDQTSTGNFDGYMSEVNSIDGYAYDASYFGFTESQTGIWMPRRYEGAYGTNGFYLDFSDNSSTAALGIDKSPNGNDLTPNNFSVTAGTGNDSLEDTPSNNFCTLNSVNGDSNTALSEGNLKAVGSTSTNYSFFTRGTIAQSSGKWYYEVEYVSNAGGNNSHLPAIGWARTTIRATDNVTVSGGLCYRPAATDYIDLDGNDTSNDKPATSTGNVIQVAIDLDAGKIWFGNGGTFFESGNPSTGANANITFTGGAETLTPFVRSLSSTFIFNFGQRAFSYTPPTGYKTLCTKNLPIQVPSFITPKKYFDILLYTGTGSANNIVEGLEFQPDWIWVKGRDTDGYEPMMIDVVRGGNNSLVTSGTDVESTHGGRSMTFYNRGVRWNSDSGNCNASGENYVMWCWKAGGTAVTNNDGSGTSQVSVNDTAGLSIVSYTGNSTGSGVTQTIGHGLGVTPELIIFKSRSFSSGDAHFATYHHEVTDASTDYMVLDTTEARVQTDTAYMNQTLPTSTVFSLGYNFTTNKSGETYIAYCFKSISGYSKFGKYTGNGSSDGTYVHLGFRPAWVMVKRTDSADNWVIKDSARNTSNEVFSNLNSNTTNNEFGSTGDVNSFDFLSNGFKIRGSNSAVNASGGTFIYISFAETTDTTPFDTFPNAR